eukprot:COSAG01_NODE_3984_length_5466_cov_1754.894354_6_plen_59_part_00
MHTRIFSSDMLLTNRSQNGTTSVHVVESLELTKTTPVTPSGKFARRLTAKKRITINLT